MNGRNPTIDAAKYVASLLVVAIHTALFSDVNDTLYFLTVNVICRMAVPFFGICTGFFLSRRLSAAKSIRPAVLQWKRLALVYAVWTVVYLVYSVPAWLETGWFSFHAFIDYGIGALTRGAHYHLWYLLGVLYALPIFCVLIKTLPESTLKRLTFLLWGINVLSYAYIPEFCSIHLPDSVVAGLLRSVIGNVLCILPLMLSGHLIDYAVNDPGRTPSIGRKKALLFPLLLIVEACFLRAYGQQAVSFIFFTLPTACLLFAALFMSRGSVKPPLAEKLGGMSVFIYCLHPMIAELSDTYIPYSIPHFLFTAGVSSALAAVFWHIKKNLSGKKVV